MNTTTASTTTDDSAAKPARRGRKGLAAVGLGLALATTAPVLAGPMTGVARAETTADPVIGSGWDYSGSHLRGRITTTDGAALRLAGDPTLGEHTHVETDGAMPKRISAEGKGSFSYSSNWGSDADLTFVYAIGDGTWELWAHATVTATMLTPNKIEGQIRRYGQTHADPDSPFEVKAEWGSTSSYDPEPTWKITRKPGEVVTDRLEQANLLNRFCKDGNGSCVYVPKSYVPNKQGAVRNVDDPFFNKTEAPVKYRYAHEVSTKWEQKVAVSASVEVEVAKVVNLGLKTTYEVSWGTEIKDLREVEADVEPGHGIQVQYAPMYAHVSGDFSIYAEGTRYDLKDVDYDFPTTGGAWQVVDVTPAHG